MNICSNQLKVSFEKTSIQVPTFHQNPEDELVNMSIEISKRLYPKLSTYQVKDVELHPIWSVAQHRWRPRLPLAHTGRNHKKSEIKKQARLQGSWSIGQIKLALLGHQFKCTMVHFTATVHTNIIIHNVFLIHYLKMDRWVDSTDVCWLVPLDEVSVNSAWCVREDPYRRYGAEHFAKDGAIIWCEILGITDM